MKKITKPVEGFRQFEYDENGYRTTKYFETIEVEEIEDYDSSDFEGLTKREIKCFAEEHNFDLDDLLDYIRNECYLDECEGCGCFASDLHYCQGDGIYICDDCYDNNYFTCECCENIYNQNELTWVNSRNGEQGWCERCSREYAFWCYGTEQYYDNYSYSSITTADTNETFENSYAYDNLYYDEDEDEYYEEAPTQRFDNVLSYHSRPSLELFGKRDKRYKTRYQHIGFELEVDRKDYSSSLNNDMAYKIRHIGGINAERNELYFNHDGSLENGFEIISQPHTYASMLKMPIKEIMELLVQNGYLSHEASTCGLHFHFSRELFGSTEEKQNLAIRKTLQFFDIFYNEMLKVSRRNSGTALQWAKPTTYDVNYKDTTTKEVLKEIKEKCKETAKEIYYKKGRYYAVNTSNENTVEFRLMRGTLKYETFIASYDLLYRLVLNSKHIKDSEIQYAELWLKGIRKETRDYIKSRGAFTNIIDNVKTK